MILLETFCAKMVDAIFSTMVAKTQRHESFVVSFTPAASPQMVEFDWPRLVVAVDVVTEGAAKACDLLFVLTFLVLQFGLHSERTMPSGTR